MPLVLDDVLVNFDTRRGPAAELLCDANDHRRCCCLLATIIFIGCSARSVPTYVCCRAK
jgi:uncharacterized protein YhaN